MKTRVIFGGSFDPVTNAHIDMAKKLAERFDEVVVVPTYISPFKKGGASLDGEERLALLKSELDGIKNLTVSDIELSVTSPSYSYITAQKLSEEGVKLYFAIGSDGLDTLDKWVRPDILAKTVTFYIVDRPYFKIDERALKRAREIYDIEIANFLGKEGSSALLKAAVAFSKEAEVVPSGVAKIIREKGLYRDYCYITERYDELKLKASRVEHIYRVCKMAIILAKKAKVSTDKAIKAALMHDITKYLTDSELLTLGVTDFGENLPTTCRHQITGAQIAKIVFGETDEEILSAISAHTTGKENMTALDKIIFAADYIEEGRDFNGVEKIRKITLENLDEGIKAIVINTVKYLENNGMEIASITKKLYDSYRSEK